MTVICSLHFLYHQITTAVLVLVLYCLHNKSKWDSICGELDVSYQSKFWFWEQDLVEIAGNSSYLSLS